MICYAASPLIVALSSCHSDITKFHPWLPKSFGSRRKIPDLISRLAPLSFLIRVQAFRDPLREDFLHVQIFKNDGLKPLTWDAQLLSYWFSRNPVVFQYWLVNLINNLRVGHCFGSSRARRITVGKITTFKLNHPVLTVAYDDDCSPNVSVRMAWISFGALPCRNKDLMIACVSMLLKSRASPNILPFSICNKERLAIQHMNRPLFATTLSFPSFDIGKYVGLSTYQQREWIK